MNTSQIQCFLTIADTLNFARAAEQLHITQPAVTQQLHALEKELGVRLFHRSTHSVRLTDEGMLFLPGLRQIPLEGGQPVSFGFYYKSWKDRPLLKAFITCAQQTLNPKKP
ncbi:hypothetical protein B5G28_04740 [Faecalibacterium sp. An77]|uniref:LysR family transcriptional regulator n=1 Tax=Faecalibacterium sp. An77 TaxID=1965655 RepID=UPI000B385928|nr:LysR family transcriptional regulator [Faecalibacterium sp. An77]OUN39630.1 hypothetical protein B5G28_04740 [Faecalibacterium sp. An77]